MGFIHDILHYYSEPWIYIIFSNFRVGKSSSPRQEAPVEEPDPDYIYDSMDATSIIGGDDGASSVGWNDS